MQQSGLTMEQSGLKALLKGSSMVVMREFSSLLLYGTSTFWGNRISRCAPGEQNNCGCVGNKFANQKDTKISIQQLY